MGEGRMGEGRMGEGRMGGGRMGEGRMGEGRMGEGRMGGEEGGRMERGKKGMGWEASHCFLYWQRCRCVHIRWITPSSSSHTPSWPSVVTWRSCGEGLHLHGVNISTWSHWGFVVTHTSVCTGQHNFRIQNTHKWIIPFNDHTGGWRGKSVI